MSESLRPVLLRGMSMQWTAVMRPGIVTRAISSTTMR